MDTNIASFREMVSSFSSERLTELCETFLTNHDDAMKTLITSANEYGLELKEVEAKRYMMNMQLNGEFDSVECFGIELGDNTLYKKFHPSIN